MKNRWNDRVAAEFKDDPKRLRVYTSRLLGAEPQLVLHGGGNTSVKLSSTDFFGESIETLFVKGSGWDLATIEAAGFAPLRLDVLKRLAQLPSLSDSDMVEQQRIAMLDSNAPNASVEAILHAILPFRYVDHTHANAVLAVTNTANGYDRIQEIYGKRVIVIPYVMPGFALAKLVYQQTQDIDWNLYDGMILMNHGIFTFSNSARDSYDAMIRLVSEAETYLANHNALQPAKADGRFDRVDLARLRLQVSAERGVPLIAKIDSSPEAIGYSRLPNVCEFGTRGPLTPDHSIFAKRVPVSLSENTAESIRSYASEYKAYFDRNATSGITCLDAAPRWAIWPGRGIVSFGLNTKDATVIGDIASHTARVVQIGESLGGWTPLKESDVFEVEYWELEQAKLKSSKSKPALQGKIALIALSRPELAKSCEQKLSDWGAAVNAGDNGIPTSSAKTETQMVDYGFQLMVDRTVQSFGGLDILVTDFDIDSPNGIPDNLLSATIPFLNLGIDPKIIAVASNDLPIPNDALQKLSDCVQTFSDRKIQVGLVNSETGEARFSATSELTTDEASSLITRCLS